MYFSVFFFIELHNIFQELAKIMGKVTAIEQNIDARAAMDDATRDAQALWIATVALNLALQNDEAKQVSLKNEVDRLVSSFGEDDFVGAVVGALPKQVTSADGILNEAAIRDRLVTIFFLSADNLAMSVISNFYLR